MENNINKRDSESERNTNKNSICLKSVNVLNPCSNIVEFPAIDCKAIRSLNLRDMILIDSIFLGILSKLNCLELMEFTNVGLVMSTPRSNVAIRRYCPSVETISFELCDWNIFSCFVAPNLRKLTLVSQNLKLYPVLVYFLNETKLLSDLTLNAISCDIMEFFGQYQYSSFQFHLKSMTLVSSSFWDAEPNASFDHFFINFMMLHINSLKFLNLKARLTPYALDFVLKKFRILRFLVLKTNLMPLDLSDENPLYQFKKPKRSVKELTLEGRYEDVNMIKSIIRAYPTVTELILRERNLDHNLNIISEILKVAADVCRDLVNLSVYRLPFNTGDQYRFTQLQSLHLGYINDTSAVRSFLKSNPSIQTLSVEFIYRWQGQAEFIATLAGFNIRTLSLTAERSEIKRIYDLIKRNKGNLKLLTFNIQEHDEEIKSFSLDLRKDSKKNLLFMEYLQAAEIKELANFLDKL